jgi:hypothetical protein
MVDLDPLETVQFCDPKRPIIRPADLLCTSMTVAKLSDDDNAKSNFERRRALYR